MQAGAEERIGLKVKGIADTDRGARFSDALKLQQASGGFAGSEYLHGSSGLAPQFWGVNKKQVSATVTFPVVVVTT